MSVYSTALISYAGTVAGKSGLGTNGYPGLISASVFDTWETNLGKRAGVVHINQRRMNNGLSYTFNADYITPLNNIRARGCIPFVTFGYWDLGTRANNYSLRLSQIAAGADDAWLTTFAQQAAAWGHRFWWRVWWEFNITNGGSSGGDFPWCVGSVNDAGNSWTNTAADFVAAWQHVDNIFQAQGATNIDMVWCPNNQSGVAGSSTNPAMSGALTSFWPGYRSDGSARVAMIAPDGYQKGSSGNGLGGTFASMYQIFRGGASTALLDTWANCLACDTSGKVQFGLSETNCYLLGGIDRPTRASYFSDALEVSIPQLNADCNNRLAVVSWFWEGAANNWGAIDLDPTSPVGGNAVFNLANVDFAAFKNGHNSAYYVDQASGIALPPDTRKLSAYWLSDQADRFRKGIHSTGPSIASPWLVGYWRATEASGNLVDDSASAVTAVAAGTPTYAQASVVPSSPSDGAIGFAADTTSGFSPGDLDIYSPSTAGAFSVECAFVCTALPVTNNGILMAKGVTGAFEWDLVISGTNGGLNWTFRNVGNTASADAHFNTPIPTNVPILVQGTWDGSTLRLYASTATGGSFGDLANGITAGTVSVVMSNTTTPMLLGRRSGTGDHTITGRVGHWQVYDAALSPQTLKEHYQNWLAAPVISAVSPGAPASSSARIAWSTDVPATSYVEYGLSTSYGIDTGVVDPSMVTAHALILPGLHPSSTYHYRVHSRNLAGAESVSADAVFATGGASPSRIASVLGSPLALSYPEATYVV